MILSNKRITKVLIRLRRCAGRSAASVVTPPKTGFLALRPKFYAHFCFPASLVNTVSFDAAWKKVQVVIRWLHEKPADFGSTQVSKEDVSRFSRIRV